MLLTLLRIQVSQVLQLAHFCGVKGSYKELSLRLEVNGRYYGRPKVC